MRNTLKHKQLLLVAATVLLAACGGGGNDAPPPPAPVTVIDAFTSFVRNLASSLIDTIEPVAITDVAITGSETNEPEAVN